MRRVPAVTVAWAIALVALAATLVTPAYLPFQDLPNHELVLEVARALRAGESSDYYHLAPTSAFAYTLSFRLDRLMAPWLDAASSLRLQVLVFALALPVAVGMLSRRLGGNRGWAMLVATPFALSWPLRMGFLAYMSGIPLFLACTALAIDLGRGARPWPRAPLLGALLALTLLAHPGAYALAGFTLALCWLTFGAGKARPMLVLLVAASPSLVMAVLDLASGSLEPVAGAELVWSETREAGFVAGSARPLDQSLAHLATLGLGIAGPEALSFQLPLVVLVLALAIHAVARSSRAEPRTVAFTLAVTAILVAGSLLVPGAVMWSYYAGERLALPAMLFVVLVACRRLAPAPPVLGAAAVVAVGLSLFQANREIHERAQHVESIVGAEPPRSLEGRRLSALLACVPEVSPYWGAYESLRHVWAYAIHPARGFSPYLFAFRGYVPFVVDPAEFGAFIATEGSLHQPLHPCEDWSRLRRLRAADWSTRLNDGSYASVLVVAPADDVARLVADSHGWLAIDRHLAPGLVTVKPGPRQDFDDAIGGRDTRDPQR